MYNKVKSFFESCVKHTPRICILVLSFFMLVAAVVTFLFFRTNYGSTISEYLEIIASIVTIASLIFVVLQVVTFVYDYRHRYVTTEKEYSSSVAKSYAKELIPKISFVNSIMYHHLGKEKFNRLLRLDPEYFDIIEGEKLLDECYFEPFRPQSTAIKSSIIESQIDFEYKSYMKLPSVIHKKKRAVILNNHFRREVVRTANLLEAFSLLMVQGLADETILYPILHQSFLKSVRVLFPHIAMANTSIENRYFSNTIALFNTWNKRYLSERSKMMKP